MRKLLAFTLVFASAATVQAQETVAQEPAGREPVTQAPTQPAAADAPATNDAPATRTPADAAPASRTDAPEVDVKTHSATAPPIEIAPVRAPVDFDQPAQDITAPQNFWWLVGAIVLGGIILAVLL